LKQFTFEVEIVTGEFVHYVGSHDWSGPNAKRAYLLVSRKDVIQCDTMSLGLKPFLGNHTKHCHCFDLGLLIVLVLVLFIVFAAFVEKMGIVFVETY
jgi:hypothetical protein